MSDIIVMPEGALVRGSDRRAHIEILPGGSGANQALWLAASGVETGLIAKVGAHDIEAQRHLFSQENVHPHFAADAETQSGRLVTIIDPDGERSFFTDRGANLNLDVSDLDPAILDGVGLLHISGYAFFAPRPCATAIALMARATAAGILISIDPASASFLAEFGTERFLATTSEATFLFANHEEAALLSGQEAPHAQLDFLASRYRFPIVKLGDRGAAALDERGSLILRPAAPATTIDTTGAGDAFFAGFVAALVKGAGIAECLDAGNRAGAIAAATLGGRPPAGA